MSSISCSFGRILFAIALVPFFYAPPAWADYSVQAGDVVEMSIGGMIDLHHRAVVQLDGTVTFPQLGTVSVAGLSASEMRKRIQAALLGKTLRQRSPDGRAIPITIEPDDIAASVVEYRPVYVMGDVAKPGQYAFHSGMTAQQAIAVAGGYDASHSGFQKQSLDTSGVESEYDAAMVQLAGLAIRETRVKAELADQPNMDETPPPDVKVPAATLSAIVHTENEIFKTRRAEYRAQKGYLERSVKESDEFMASLNEKSNQEDHGQLADAHELEDLLGLQKKGYTSNVRVTDTRHAVSQAAARKLVIEIQLDKASQRKQDFQKQLSWIESQRKIALLNDLKDGAIRQSELRSKIRSLRDRVRTVLMTRSQNTRSESQSPKIVVIRSREKGRQRLSADEDFELQPADVVEVAIPSDELNREIARN